MKLEATAPPIMTDTGGLYPDLPVSDNPAGTHTYRLQEISLLKKRLEDERDKRAELYKKYHRGVNVLDGIDSALIMTSMGVGVVGAGLLSSIIAAPVGLGLEIAALACGVLGLTGRFIGRRLAVKTKKHDEVRILAESKLNTISDHVSRALVDAQVSDEEFRLILDESNKFDQMKAEIRAGAKKKHGAITPPALDEDTKKSLIQRGRDEARDSLIKKLSTAP